MKLRAKKLILPQMERLKPAMKAEINLCRARNKDGRSDFAMDSSMFGYISSREPSKIIDIILSFMCMGVPPRHHWHGQETGHSIS